MVVLIFGSPMCAARAWDSTGHMLIDEIAWQNVTPEVRERVRVLVEKLENKYNNHKPYNFITAGCYMDDMRAAPGYPYITWHFMDVDYKPDARGYAEPEPPQVLWAIERSIETFGNPRATGQQKSEALAMIMHFVADIHQPLHCVNWNDRGGNGYFIAGIPFTDLSKKQVPNLHAFWDRAYRYDVKKGKVVELYYSLWTSERPDVAADGIIRNQAERIIERFPLTSLAELARVGDPHAWAHESYGFACRFGYPRRPHPENYEVVTLTPDFITQASWIACRRIALAGYRLANLLNRLFSTDG